MALSAKQRAQMNNRSPDGTFKSAGGAGKQRKKKQEVAGGAGKQRPKPKNKRSKQLAGGAGKQRKKRA